MILFLIIVVGFCGWIAGLLIAAAWQCIAVLFHLAPLVPDQVQAIGGLTGIAAMAGVCILLIFTVVVMDR